MCSAEFMGMDPLLYLLHIYTESYNKLLELHRGAYIKMIYSVEDESNLLCI